MVSLLRAAAVAAASAVVILAAYEVYAMQPQQPAFTGVVPSSFTVNGKTHSFTYAATTRAQWEAGLMNTKVTNTTTMLFAFPYFAQWSFWMYDTNTSLDIIWLNATGSSATVVYLVTMAPPCYISSDCKVYTPSAAANYAIEAKSGFAAVNRIQVGTAVKLG